MAAHIPIPTDELVLKTIKSFERKHNIKDLEFFERIPHGKCTIQRLTPDYEMNEYHGLIDDEIIAINYQQKTLEIHIDNNKKINQVYLIS